MNRRRFLLVPLSVMALAGGAAVDLERLLPRYDGRTRPLDGPTLDGFKALTHLYIQHMHTMPPDLLLPQVRDHLTALLRFAESPGQRHREAMALVAETAAVAGKLSFTAGNVGDALQFYHGAERAAVECGHAAIHAYVLGQSSHLHSTFWHAGPGSASVHDLLDAALAACGSTVPAYLRVWLLVRRAEERAVVGNAAGAYSDLEAAAQALGKASDTVDEWGFFKHWETAPQARLAGYRGNCQRLLGRSGHAIESIEGAVRLVGSSYAYVRTCMLADLASAYVREGDVDHACSLIAEALSSATRAGLIAQIQRAMGVRRELAKWDDLPAVKQLDEQLRDSVRGVQ